MDSQSQLKFGEWTVDSLTKAYPDIEWDKPIKVTRGDSDGYACRVCVANEGFGPVNALISKEACEQHIREKHLEV